jgi:hypothetical protein
MSFSGIIYVKKKRRRKYEEEEEELLCVRDFSFAYGAYI